MTPSHHNGNMKPFQGLAGGSIPPVRKLSRFFIFFPIKRAGRYLVSAGFKMQQKSPYTALFRIVELISLSYVVKCVLSFLSNMMLPLAFSKVMKLS